MYIHPTLHFSIYSFFYLFVIHPSIYLSIHVPMPVNLIKI